MRSSAAWRIGAAIGAMVVVTGGLAIALGSASSPPDPDATAINGLCRAAERKVKAAERQGRALTGREEPQALGWALTNVLARLRERLEAVRVSRDRIRQEIEMSGAIFEAKNALLAVSKLELPSGRQIAVAVRRVKAASQGLERLSSDLGLGQCVDLAAVVASARLNRGGTEGE
jgi:hypothetical protein